MTAVIEEVMTPLGAASVVTVNATTGSETIRVTEALYSDRVTTVAGDTLYAEGTYVEPAVSRTDVRRMRAEKTARLRTRLSVVPEPETDEELADMDEIFEAMTHAQAQDQQR